MADKDNGADALGDLTRRVDEDETAVGLVLTGSQARQGMVTQHSDTDVIVIVDTQGRERWRGSHSSELDIAIYTRDELSTPALPRVNIDDWWNRYAFTHAIVLRDKLAGEIQKMVTAQGTLAAAEAITISQDFLDDYINFAVRSLKSSRDGRLWESRLDAVESIAAALVTIYALEGRVRPYNKYLRWDQANYPLQSSEFESTRLQSLLDGLQTDSHPQYQRILFGLIEEVARQNGADQVIDEWGDDLELFR